MSDHRGWMMAEQEHAARLAAVKERYEAEIERLRALLLEARHILIYREWPDTCKRIDAALRAADQPPGRPCCKDAPKWMAVVSCYGDCPRLDHPVDALKNCGVEMTPEQEAQLRAYCDEHISMRKI